MFSSFLEDRRWQARRRLASRQLPTRYLGSPQETVALLVDNRPIAFEPGDSLLLALVRSRLHPMGGGCLCFGGDCGNCLATVNGVPYVRTCQIPASPDDSIELEHLDRAVPALLRNNDDAAHDPANHVGVTRPMRHLSCDRVVIGQGSSGVAAALEAKAAGLSVIALDANQGQEVIGLYNGPSVVARTAKEMLTIRALEVIVATGAAEIQPVVPGSQLCSLFTARAASLVARAGIDLGHLVAFGRPPEGVAYEQAHGRLIRFEGNERVTAVVVQALDGSEETLSCDAVSLGLGFQPRDGLARMGQGQAVRAVGSAAKPSDIPDCPSEGTVCPCAGVTFADLESVWERGFRELELVKRATLTGTGTCQGSTCLPYMRSFLAHKEGTAVQPPFTARPLARQATIGDLASDCHHSATLATALDATHRAAGAHMERSGGWWRPWSYPDEAAEYRAVRQAVSLGDVSTLGKFEVSGPDAVSFLEWIYPTQIASIKPGGSRYALLLDERGYVLDDGLVCRHTENRFTLTLTSAGSTFGEMWLRDWAAAGATHGDEPDRVVVPAENLKPEPSDPRQPQKAVPFDIRILNQTFSRGAINVTGPLAAKLLERAGVQQLPSFARHLKTTVAGIDCRVYRLSFTGELSYELHHEAGDSALLWQRLLEAGEPFGVHPHGLKTLLDLRLEKGHLVVGMDTAFDSTARRLQHEWAVKMDKGHFVGRQALLRTESLELNRQLLSFVMASPAPPAGAAVTSKGHYVGYVTSSCDSETLGQAVLLAWIDLVEGKTPQDLCIAGRSVSPAPAPFYDPKAERSRTPVSLPSSVSERKSLPFQTPPPLETALPGASHFERLRLTRVVTTAQALDSHLEVWNRRFEPGAVRLAEDEALVFVEVDKEALGDPHALVEPETGFAGFWLEADKALALLERHCAWPLPEARPAFSQGALAQIPVKIFFGNDRVLIMTLAALAHPLEERLFDQAPTSISTTEQSL